jgi:hypothetical protein
MNLYLVQQDGYGSTRRFITATDKKTALAKWLEVVSSQFHDKSTVTFLCKRDEIIPCIDPVIEFEKMQADFYELHSKNTPK